MGLIGCRDYFQRIFFGCIYIYIYTMYIYVAELPPWDPGALVRNWVPAHETHNEYLPGCQYTDMFSCFLQTEIKHIYKYIYIYMHDAYQGTPNPSRRGLVYVDFAIDLADIYELDMICDWISVSDNSVALKVVMYPFITFYKRVCIFIATMPHA